MSLLTLGALLTGVLITAAGIVGLVGELASAGSTGGALSSASPDQAATQAANPESGDARNGGVATGPGGLLGLIGALLLPLLVGALIALVARAVARWRSAGSRISE